MSAVFVVWKIRNPQSL